MRTGRIIYSWTNIKLKLNGFVELTFILSIWGGSKDIYNKCQGCDTRKRGLGKHRSIFRNGFYYVS